jgi:hypothetical protein
VPCSNTADAFTVGWGGGGGAGAAAGALACGLSDKIELLKAAEVGVRACKRK